MMALGLELKRRKHEVVFGTPDCYRKKLEEAGFGFSPVRPHISPDDPEAIHYFMDKKKGPERLLRELLFPNLRSTYEDLMQAMKDADVLISGSISYAAPLAAEKTGKPWASSMLAPLGFFSVHDPPALSLFPAYTHLRYLGSSITRGVFNILRRRTREWVKPVLDLRHELGLKTDVLDPIIEGQHSEQLVLAMYSKLLGDVQPDFPPHTHITGFAFYDRQFYNAGINQEIKRFLESGPDKSGPLVFTLGSTIGNIAKGFYREAAICANKLRQRAILLTGTRTENIPHDLLNERVAAFEYGPYSELFPSSKIVIHQGGIGTTGQAMAAGVPMLVLPVGLDHFDNAARVKRLGIARVLPMKWESMPSAKVNSQNLSRIISEILDRPSCFQKAKEVQAFIRSEGGVKQAGNLVDALVK